MSTFQQSQTQPFPGGPSSFQYGKPPQSGVPEIPEPIFSTGQSQSPRPGPPTVADIPEPIFSTGSSSSANFAQSSSYVAGAKGVADIPEPIFSTRAAGASSSAGFAQGTSAAGVPDIPEPIFNQGNAANSSAYYGASSSSYAQQQSFGAGAQEYGAEAQNYGATGYDASAGADYNASAGADYTASAGADYAGADYTASAGADYTASAGADYTASAGADYNASAGADYTASAGADYTASAGADYTASAGADYTASAGVQQYGTSSAQYDVSGGATYAAETNYGAEANYGAETNYGAEANYSAEANYGSQASGGFEQFGGSASSDFPGASVESSRVTGRPSSKLISSITVPLKTVPPTVESFSANQIPQAPKPQNVPTAAPTLHRSTSKVISSVTIPLKDIPQSLSGIPTAPVAPVGVPSRPVIPPPAPAVIPKVDPASVPRAYPEMTTRTVRGGTTTQPTKHLGASTVAGGFSTRTLPVSYEPPRTTTGRNLPTITARPKMLNNGQPLSESRPPIYEKVTYNRSEIQGGVRKPQNLSEIHKSSESRGPALQPISQRPVVLRPLNLAPIVRPAKYESATVKYNEPVSGRVLAPKYMRPKTAEPKYTTLAGQRNSRQVVRLPEKQINVAPLPPKYLPVQYKAPLRSTRSAGNIFTPQIPPPQPTSFAPPVQSMPVAPEVIQGETFPEPTSTVPFAGVNVNASRNASYQGGFTKTNFDELERKSIRVGEEDQDFKLAFRRKPRPPFPQPPVGGASVAGSFQGPPPRPPFPQPPAGGAADANIPDVVFNRDGSIKGVQFGAALGKSQPPFPQPPAGGASFAGAGAGSASFAGSFQGPPPRPPFPQPPAGGAADANIPDVVFNRDGSIKGVQFGAALGSGAAAGSSSSYAQSSSFQTGGAFQSTGLPDIPEPIFSRGKN